MGSKRLDSVDRFARYGYAVQAQCRSCGHTAKLDPRPITEEAVRRGWSRDMTAIERRLKCSKCRERNVSCGPVFG